MRSIETWVAVHTPVGKRNIVCGPFDDMFDACNFVSLEFDYETISFHDTYESAAADTTKIAFVPPAANG